MLKKECTFINLVFQNSGFWKNIIKTRWRKRNGNHGNILYFLPCTVHEDRNKLVSHCAPCPIRKKLSVTKNFYCCHVKAACWVLLLICHLWKSEPKNDSRVGIILPACWVMEWLCFIIYRLFFFPFSFHWRNPVAHD